MGDKKKPHKGEGHRARLREKFLTSGLRGFHDYEVIELLLTSVNVYPILKAYRLRSITL
jgi:DNA repair protein RadC